MPKQEFDQREWVNDIVTGAIAGVASGAVGALLVPDPPFIDLMVGGGIVGLVSQMVVLPVRWLLNRRPDVPDETQLNEENPKS